MLPYRTARLSLSVVGDRDGNRLQLAEPQNGAKPETQLLATPRRETGERVWSKTHDGRVSDSQSSRGGEPTSCGE